MLQALWYSVILIDNNRNTMPFKKGQSGNPNGRPKGSSNAETNLVRDAFSELINNNLNNVNDWLAEVGKANPLQALKIVIKMSDYVLPKLSRVKHIQEVKEMKLEIQIVKPKCE